MYVLQSKQHFRKVKSRIVFTEATFALKQIEKLTPAAEIHYKM